MRFYRPYGTTRAIATGKSNSGLQLNHRGLFHLRAVSWVEAETEERFCQSENSRNYRSLAE